MPMESSIFLALFWIFILHNTSSAIIPPSVGHIDPGFSFNVSQIQDIDNGGLFLISEKSTFGFGFSSSPRLVIIHLSSSRVVWSAYREAYVRSAGRFVFENDGNAYWASWTEGIWSTDTSGQGVTAMELQDSGNLVLLGKDRSIIWQSFSHPTDTLLPGQEFVQGMKLVSRPNKNSFRYHLEIESGDILLYINYPTPQPYWSMSMEPLIITKKVGSVFSVSIVNNSLDFFDQSKGLLRQFIFSTDASANATWSAVLDNTGVISFYDMKASTSTASIQIPKLSCSIPGVCGSYEECSYDYCQCSPALRFRPVCSPGFNTSCDTANDAMQLIDAGPGMSISAINYVRPFSRNGDLNGCKDWCLQDCSCVVLFFDTSSKKCYLFDHVGGLLRSNGSYAVLVSYIKVSGNGERRQSSDRKEGEGSSDSPNVTQTIVVSVVTLAAVVIVGLLYLGFQYHKKKKLLSGSLQESEENHFLGSLTGVPRQFTYKELEEDTNNFSLKLGQGGFGSVYKGKLKDGTNIAVKELQGIRQGKKEFHAEVRTIGIVRHTNLVRLKGLCVEGSHRLLIYEYMANNSLDKWIFKKTGGGKLDWLTRYDIAVGTAKGLAYLHQDCDAKIIHCDVKPENILLDEHFHAKLSDFGLAKLMTREQSHVFTKLRGTRGYLAPEWIVNHVLSEKSDVYSFGMVLLELIRGMRNFDTAETSERVHFPSYAIKMAEEKRLHEVLDPYVEIEEETGSMLTVMQVALCCIHRNRGVRPSMSRVVQMLEGVCDVPELPTSSVLVNVFEIENSNADLSAVTLSGPR